MTPITMSGQFTFRDNKKCIVRPVDVPSQLHFQHFQASRLTLTSAITLSDQLAYIDNKKYSQDS